MMFNNGAWETQKEIPITTMDWNQRPYEVLGTVYFQIRNVGKPYNELMKTYQPILDEMKAAEKIPNSPRGFFNTTGSDLEQCFFIGQEALKNRARILGADAIIGFKEDTDFPWESQSLFFMQMYGTAIRFVSA